jgi:hypothetical protein
MFEVVSKVVLSAPKALQKTGLDSVNIGPFYGSKPSQNPLTSELPSYHLNNFNFCTSLLFYLRLSLPRYRALKLEPSPQIRYSNILRGKNGPRPLYPHCTQDVMKPVFPPSWSSRLSSELTRRAAASPSNSTTPQACSRLTQRASRGDVILETSFRKLRPTWAYLQAALVRQVK